MSDDTEGQLINFPVGTDVTDRPPQLPDPGRLFPDAGERSVIPPESPEETTLELPAVPAAPRPEAALVSSREIPLADPGGMSAEEISEGGYVQPRSLADRLGDWLEYRLEVARDRHASEASFREAEIARKTALLEARTAQETATMEQNGKLHAAQMKAKADKAAARGKAGADGTRSSSSGMGSDKGRSKAGGGGGSSGGSGQGSGTNGSGGTGHGSGGGNSPKGTGKGPDRSSGGRGSGAKGNESSGGSKDRRNGSGGSGPGKGSSGKGSSGGSGKNSGSGGSHNSGSGKGGSKGDGGTSQNSPASNSRAERTRGRQERAAARQAARQQRRGADQAAHLADRSKDRDQDRADRQAEREERRAAKAERKAARKAKREAATAADDRTTLGAAVAEEAQRRWDKRRADAKAAKDGTEKGSLTKDKEKDAQRKGGTGSKGEEDARDASDGSSGAAKDGKASDEPGKDSKTGDGPPDSSEKRRRFRHGRTGRAGRQGRTRGPHRTRRTGRRERSEDSPFGAQDSTPTTEWPEHDTRPPKPAAQSEDDIVDAVIVDDPSDPFGAHVSSPAGLPRAPEPHTERPGTTRPTAQEDSVASEVRTTASGQTGLAAQHRTDITFDEYLTEIVNIAIAAALDKDRAQDLAVALGKVADALRDMAADLVGDHNIATEVVGQVLDLADTATRMKQRAERCATECEIASEAARIAATAVGRVYGEDIQAMDDAGLAHASAAAHHD